MRMSAVKWGGLALLAAVLSGWLSRDRWLGSLGSFLDTGAPPVSADVIVVLAGGWTGERVLKAGELVRAGYAPVAILDSPKGLLYGESECELAKGLAARHGYPREMFDCLEMNATSTREEAAKVAAELKKRGVKKCLVVSVRSHMRRAERLMRRATPGVDLHFTGAENPFYQLDRWHQTREGRKAIFLEWFKTVTDLFGI